MVVDQYSMFNMYDVIKKDGMTKHMLRHAPNIVKVVCEHGISPYLGTMFEFILGMTGDERGDFAEEYIAVLAKELGIWTQKAKNGGGWDLVLNGINVEVKFASAMNRKQYQIKQIRDQDYAYLIAVIITPHRAEIFTIPKDVLLSNDKCKGHHGGTASVETKVYTASYQEWLYTFGQYVGIEFFYRTFTDANLSKAAPENN